MLEGINHKIPADVLNTLFVMGHGDSVVFVDSNFPARSVAGSTTLGKEIGWAVDSTTALTVILDHFPIDTYQPEIPPVQAMQVVGEPEEVPEAVRKVTPLVQGRGHDIIRVERMAFYERAKTSFAIIKLAEHRAYGNFMLRKGVVVI